MNEYHGPSRNEWEQQWRNAYEREADAMVDEAFADYDERLKSMRQHVLYKTDDPLERIPASVRVFRIEWGDKIIAMAHDTLTMSLGHADMHRAGL